MTNYLKESINSEAKINKYYKQIDISIEQCGSQHVCGPTM